MKKEKTFRGLNWDEMGAVLNTLCGIDNDILFSDEEQKAIDVAVQCVAQIMNRMKDDRPIIWD